ncbi:MAG: M15 family metallopeptidase [Prevotellaceae bacterium]|nr:M15 family metallopeptidase [Prevotellaceae bacterium]
MNTTYSNYWLWSNPKCSETDKIQYTNRIPIEIVKVFEKHGFIWGGKWYHYDTMHFEYRPEFFID